MRPRVSSLTRIALLASLVGQSALVSPIAQSDDITPLTGQVSSAEEGTMEGVLVSAKKSGSTWTTTVVSDAQGRYRFPRTKLDSGQYALAVRAIGYDLDGDPSVSVVDQKTTTADLRLRKTRDLAAQLTNAEWLDSFPGTDEQKASVRGCAHCHTLERVTRSKHDVAAFAAVIERMSGYPPLAFPLMPQRTPAPRIGGGAVDTERQQQAWRRQAEDPERREPELESALELCLQDTAPSEG